MFKTLVDEIDAIRARDPAARSRPGCYYILTVFMPCGFIARHVALPSVLARALFPNGAGFSLVLKSTPARKLAAAACSLIMAWALSLVKHQSLAMMSPYTMASP